jgi:hypothetical protein
VAGLAGAGAGVGVTGVGEGVAAPAGTAAAGAAGAVVPVIVRRGAGVVGSFGSPLIVWLLFPYSVTRRCSASALARRSLNQGTVTPAATAAKINPPPLATVITGKLDSPVGATGCEAK